MAALSGKSGGMSITRPYARVRALSGTTEQCYKSFMTKYRSILFLCTGNSCRSQIAEGLARDLVGKDTTVYSAGTHPSHVSPMAVTVMEEIGIDISHHTSKKFDTVPAVELVVTVCESAAMRCPNLQGTQQTEHWDIPDPMEFVGSTGERITGFRKVRDVLQEKIRALLGY